MQGILDNEATDTSKETYCLLLQVEDTSQITSAQIRSRAYIRVWQNFTESCLHMKSSSKLQHGAEQAGKKNTEKENFTSDFCCSGEISQNSQWVLHGQCETGTIKQWPAIIPGAVLRHPRRVTLCPLDFLLALEISAALKFAPPCHSTSSILQGTNL